MKQAYATDWNCLLCIRVLFSPHLAWAMGVLTVLCLSAGSDPRRPGRCQGGPDQWPARRCVRPFPSLGALSPEQAALNT